MTEWFKPLHSKPRPHDILAFDLEGSGVRDGFVCGSIVGLVVSGFYTNCDDMFDALLHYAYDGYWIFSHNLQYDLPVLEGDAFPRGQVVFTKYNILSSKYKIRSRNVKFYDSANIFPRHSVADIGEMTGYPKDDLPDDLLAKLSKGRPWNEFSPIDQERIRKYCTRDAEIVYTGVTLLQELVLSLGGELHPTISGTAMDIFRRKYHKWPWPCVGEKTNELCRPAFYGGRVENYAIGRVENVSMYDVTSLYPHVQALARYPHPNHLRLDVDPSLTDQFWKGEGICEADVTLPDTFIPSLPYRYQSRLFFPIGRMRGSWTIFELRRALEWGAVLNRVEWVLWSPVTFNPFEDFVQDLFALRSYYLSKSKGEANLVKLLLNSLYGRWGLNPNGGLFRLVDLDNDEDVQDYQGYSTFDVNGRLLGFGSIQTTHYPDYINVLIAAQISSSARIHLLDELNKQGENMVYCDTDSIVTRGKIQTSEGLGGWREVMRDGSADMIGLKEYALHNAVNGTKYVAKGVPPEVAQEYLQTGVARFFHAIGIREALRDRRRPSTWIETFRTRGETFPKRYPVPPWRATSPDFLPTRAYLASELPLVVQGLFLPSELDPDYRGRVLKREGRTQQGRLKL